MPSRKKSLTANEDAILGLVKANAAKGKATSIENVRAYMFWRSRSTAAEVVDNIIRKGWLRRTRRTRKLVAT